MRNIIDVCKRIILGKEGYLKSNQKAIQKLLVSEGPNALKTLFDLGKREQVEFSVFFGTLLGAYREHGFIKHDDDIDVVMDIKYLSTSLINALQQVGFVIKKVYITSDFKGCQIPMKYKGLTVDIYVMFKDMSDLYHIYTPFAFKGYQWGFSSSINIFRLGDIKFPYWNSVTTCKLQQIDINIPDNAHAVLSALYGADFMTPKKGAKAGSEDEDIQVWDGYYSVYPIDFCLRHGLLEAVRDKHLKNE